MADPGNTAGVNRLVVRRGEVWLTRLDPTEGHEIRKTRPCLVVSADGMNVHLGTIIVMPLTSGSKPARFRVATQFRKIPGLLLGDQIRCVSKARLVRRLGTTDKRGLSAALSVLREMFEE